MKNETNKKINPRDETIIKSGNMVAIIIQQLKELETLCKIPTESEVGFDKTDYNYLKECLKRWRDRTISVLTENISTEEGLKFKRMSMIAQYGQSNEIYFRKTSKLFWDYLMALKTEIEAHPEYVLMLSRKITKIRSEQQVTNQSENSKPDTGSPKSENEKWWKNPKSPWFWSILFGLLLLILAIIQLWPETQKISLSEKIAQRASIECDSIVFINSLFTKPHGQTSIFYPLNNFETAVTYEFLNNGNSEAYPIIWICVLDSFSSTQLNFRDSLLNGKIEYSSCEDFPKAILKHSKYKTGNIFKDVSFNTNGHIHLHLYILYKDIFEDWRDYYSITTAVFLPENSTIKKFPPLTSTNTFNDKEIKKIKSRIFK